MSNPDAPATAAQYATIETLTADGAYGPKIERMLDHAERWRAEGAFNVQTAEHLLKMLRTAATTRIPTPGERVLMEWAHGRRIGVVVAPPHGDGLTGAAFVPVQWSDGTTSNADTRVRVALDAEALVR